MRAQFVQLPPHAWRACFAELRGVAWRADEGDELGCAELPGEFIQRDATTSRVPHLPYLSIMVGGLL